MKRIGLLVLALLLMVSAVSVLAQDDAPACDAAASADVLAGLVEALRSSDSPVEALQAIAVAARSAEAACMGLSFNSTVITADEVVGPIEVAEGIYLATMTGEPKDYVTLEVTELDGDCNLIGGYLFIGAEDGDQKVWEVGEGCRALLSFKVGTLDFGKDKPVWDVSIEMLD